jgi:RNA polymerase sigma-70 factor (ECF subfamily)
MSAVRLGPETGAARAPDGPLVRRVLGGEREAFGELVRRHQEVLYRYLRGMGADHDTAVDLIQDAFVKAYGALASCREPEHFRAWLFRIARNHCLDHVKNVRQLSIPLSALPGVDAIADERAPGLEPRLILRAALERLPTALREAFLLKHDAGYAYDEIAELTGASVSAVKMRVHRARESLREFLAKQGIDAA